MAGPLRHFARFTTGWTPPTDDDASYDGDHPWVTIGDMTGPWIGTTERSLSDAAVAGRIPCQPGDLLFAFKLSVGTVARALIPLYTNEAIATFSPTEHLDLGYAVYALPIFLLRNTQTNIYGAQLLNNRRILSAHVHLPPLGEQHAIADYLDRETARIDTLIEEQQRLIDLLRERRTAVARHAVTSGLSDQVERQTSQVPWLAHVPTHWDIQQLRRVGTTDTGSGFPVRFQGKTDLPYPFFKVKHLSTGARTGVIVEADDTVDDSIVRELSARVFPRGTLAFAKIGAALLLGRVRELGCPGCLDNNLAGFIVNRSLDNRFAYHMLSQIDFSYLVNPGAVPSISDKNFLSYPVAIPPLPEQRDIAENLDRQVRRIDNLIIETERFIDLARERRSALITAAVTGQVDVREMAA